jgi:hypothetical protein
MMWRLGLRGLEWGWRWDGSEATAVLQGRKRSPVWRRRSLSGKKLDA